MKSDIITIARKELARFFSNKTSACIAIVLPGLLIYAMWSFMGTALSDGTKADETKMPTIAVVNLPASIEPLTADFEIIHLDVAPEGDDIRAAIKQKEYGAVVVFPEDFDAAVTQRLLTRDGAAPHVEVFYDSTQSESGTTFSLFKAVLDGYKASLGDYFNINTQGGTYDVSDERSRAGAVLVSIVPMILLIMIFSGCMSIAAESIAGEKERGTMATLLATPAKRSHIALGKVLALALIGLAIAASSAIGIFASLPNLTRGVVDVNVYGVAEYTLLGLIIFSTALITVTVIALVSALAKTTKEAQIYLTPLMIVVALVGVLGMFGDGAKTDIGFYFIPLYNSIQCMIGIFTFDFQPVNVVVCVASNLAYTGIGVVALQRMFNSERLMFAR